MELRTFKLMLLAIVMATVGFSQDAVVKYANGEPITEISDGYDFEAFGGYQLIFEGSNDHIVYDLSLWNNLTDTLVAGWLPTVDTFPTYKAQYTHNMTGSQQKALKSMVNDDWGQPTLSHATRVIGFQGPSVVVEWRRYDSNQWKNVILEPTFKMRSKWQTAVIFDWIRRAARSHWNNRYYIIRNDHDFSDAAWAAAEHYERFMRMIGFPLDVVSMNAIDESGRRITVIDQGKLMNKPNNFRQIETGKKRP